MTGLGTVAGMGPDAARRIAAAVAQLDNVLARMRSEWAGDLADLLSDPDSRAGLAMGLEAYRAAQTEGDENRLLASDMRIAQAALARASDELATVWGVAGKLQVLAAAASQKGMCDLTASIAELVSWIEDAAIATAMVADPLARVGAALPAGDGSGPGDAIRGSARDRFVQGVAFQFHLAGLPLRANGPFGEFIGHAIAHVDGRFPSNSSLCEIVRRSREALQASDPSADTSNCQK